MRAGDISRYNIRRPSAPGEKVVVGMSGGVDSSVAAALLKESGYSVTGLTLRFLCDSCGRRDGSDDDSVSRSRDVCGEIGIEHRTKDVSAEFREKVIRYFTDEYRDGRTPNPCIVCNEKVKFPAISAVADSLGARKIATGHYARLARDGKGRLLLGAATDRSKDQGYFLYRVPVRILKKTLFPLAYLRKDEVLSIADGIGLHTKAGKESQDICFLPGGDISGFLGARIGTAEGDVVDCEGNVLGRHDGIYRYTIGQRKGLGIASGAPMYVRSLDPVRNRIVLAGDEDLFTGVVECSSLRMRVMDPRLPLDAKIRYRHVPAKVRSLERRGNSLTVVFDNPQRAVTGGQSLVLYSGGMIIGGGLITGPARLEESRG